MEIILEEKDLFEEYVKVAVIQIDSPFGDQIKHETSRDGKPIFAWDSSSIEERRQVVKSILETIENKKARILVFPEYSIPADLIDDLIIFARKTKSLIIAGSHQVINPTALFYRQNVSPVILPSGDVHYCQKEILTKEENKIVLPGKPPGLKIIANTTEGKVSIYIAICRDYISGKIDFPSDEKGLVIVIMCNKEQKNFEALASVHLTHQKFVILCNAIGSMAIGNSSLWAKCTEGVTGEPALRLNRQAEQLFFADLNLQNPLEVGHSKPTLVAKSSPARAMKNLETLDIICNAGYCKIVKSDSAEQVGVINPRIFYDELDYHLTLAFFKTDDWLGVRKKLLNNDVISYGLFGRFDLLCKAYESKIYPLNMRLKNLNIFENLHSKDYFKVTKILKYASFNIDWSDNIKLELSHNDIVNLDIAERNWEGLEIEIRNDLIKRGLLFPRPIKPKSWQQNGHIKAFLFVNFSVITGYDEMPIFFINEIEKKYSDKIISIYIQNEFAMFRVIFEVVVSDLNQLIDGILNDIHSSFPSLINSRDTETYLTVLPLHANYSTIIKETEKHKTSVQHRFHVDNALKEIENIIDSNKDRSLKKISDEELKNRSLQAALKYIEIKPMVDKLALNFDENIKNLFYAFLEDFIIGCLSAQKENLGIAYNTLFSVIEKRLVVLFLSNVNNKFENIKEAELVLKMQPGKLRGKTPKISPGELKVYLENWNKNYPEEKFFSNKGVESLAKTIQVRNVCVHGNYELVSQRDIENAIFEVFEVIKEFSKITIEK